MSAASAATGAHPHQPATSAESSPAPELTLLFDGGCPLCLREVDFLRRRVGSSGRMAFVDIDSSAYRPDDHAGISYREAMGRIHAIDAEGQILKDLEVFRRAYELIGLGWIYAPTRWPLLKPLAAALYGLWARARLRLTGRPDLDELCRSRQNSGGCRL